MFKIDFKKRTNPQHKFLKEHSFITITKSNNEKSINTEDKQEDDIE